MSDYSVRLPSLVFKSNGEGIYSDQREKRRKELKTSLAPYIRWTGEFRQYIVLNYR